MTEKRDINMYLLFSVYLNKTPYLADTCTGVSRNSCLSHWRAVKTLASLRVCTISPEHSLLGNHEVWKQRKSKNNK